MSTFESDDYQGTQRIVSNQDVILEADRDQTGAGDLVFRTGGVERARIDHAGTGTGWPSVIGGSLSPIFNVVTLYGADNTGATTTTTPIQNAIDACNAAGGGIVYFPAGLYRHTGLSRIGPQTVLMGSQESATILRLNGGSNTPSLKSINYDTLVGGTDQTWQDGTPYAIRIENLLLEGNRSSQTGGVSHAIALFAFRCVLRNVYIYDHDGDGIHWQSGGSGQSTGTYPNAQIESVMENIWIRHCSGKGIAYSGPTDAYGDRIFVSTCDGIGLDVNGIDFGYVHVYGCLQGLVMNGDCRIEHLEAENNINEGFVNNNTSVAKTNHVSRLTAFDNWTSATAGDTNFSVDLLGTTTIGDLSIHCGHSDSGLHMSTAADYSQVATGKIVGFATNVRRGFHCEAKYVSVDLDISTFSIGCLFGFSHNQGRKLTLRITACPTGFSDNAGSPSDGHHIDISYEATSNTYIPWVFSWAFGSTPSKSFYRLVSWNQIVTSFASAPTGVIDSRNTLDSGQGTIQRRDATSSISLPSGWVFLTYFTARKFETINNIAGFTGAAAAGATPTLCRMGLYSVASNGDLTLVASCASDTTLFAATATAYSRALSASYAMIAGARYAFAYIIVTGAALPSIPGLFFPGPGSELTTTGPTEAAHISGQTDLPSTIAVGSLAATQNMLYGKVTP